MPNQNEIELQSLVAQPEPLPTNPKRLKETYIASSATAIDGSILGFFMAAASQEESKYLVETVMRGLLTTGIFMIMFAALANLVVSVTKIAEAHREKTKSSILRAGMSFIAFLALSAVVVAHFLVGQAVPFIFVINAGVQGLVAGASAATYLWKSFKEQDPIKKKQYREMAKNNAITSLICFGIMTGAVFIGLVAQPILPLIGAISGAVMSVLAVMHIAHVYRKERKARLALKASLSDAEETELSTNDKTNIHSNALLKGQDSNNSSEFMLKSLSSSKPSSHLDSSASNDQASAVNEEEVALFQGNTSSEINAVYPVDSSQKDHHDSVIAHFHYHDEDEDNVNEDSLESSHSYSSYGLTT